MMIAICIGAFISHFTAGVVNISLPHLTSVFHTNFGTIQWITTGYLLVITALLPVMGRLGDRYGHKRFIFLGLAGMGSGLLLFTLYLDQLSPP
ncbi:hypothetical protein CWS01_10070 [Niallia nealsonii]|uniref:Major facilitator superfamily (MFS) profile domain-containing protein n=2 Tax=Niallia nealsonii TaxID=115979 RepID=A0A2N0Z2U9_9BACI|nr:hypothetical protein CWS01_10070 [Niallia nealsonii]